MLNKKIFMVLLLLIVGICAISTVSATDNLTDTVTVDDANSGDVAEVINDETSGATDDATNEVKEDAKTEDTLASTQDDTTLAADKSSDVLSSSPATASMYKIAFTQKSYSFNGINGANITYTIDPCKNTKYNCYNFQIGIFRIYPNNETLVSASGIFASNNSNERKKGTYYYTIPAKKLTPGNYRIMAFNYNGKEVDTIMANATLTVKKVPVTMKAYRATTYQGRYITLKATVRKAGKGVTEGSVTFSLRGKKYKVRVKKGIATKKIMMHKNGRFTYSATFNSANYNTTKVYSKAIVKRSYRTRVIVANQWEYRSLKPKPFYVKVKASNGKYVLAGKIKIIDTVRLKRGLAKFYYPDTDWNYNGQYLNLVYFKKVVSKTYTVKFIPTSNIYQPSSKKIKLTVYYRCTACGKKTSHYHNGMYFMVT